MIKDITIGQYFAGNSFIHRLEPRTKLICTVLFIVMLFLDTRFFALIIGAAYVAIALYMSKLNFKLIMKSVKPLIPILIITAIFNVIFIHSGEVLFKWYFIKITDRGISNSLFMIFRIIILIIGCSLLTYTTTPIQLTDAIERLLSPLKKFKFPVAELAMMMTIALRFIPTLVEETQKIVSAQKARGAYFESGNFMEKAKSFIPVLVPLFVSAFRRAEELATAMESRCYIGGEGRTKMKQTVMTASDVLTIVFTLLFILLVISMKILIKIKGEI